MTRILLITGTYITISEFASGLEVNADGYYTVTIETEGSSDTMEVLLYKENVVYIENTSI